MTDDVGKLVFGLREIARNIQHWVDWNTEERTKEGLPTDKDHALMIVPHWPSRDALKLWAETITAGADSIDSRLPREDGWNAYNGLVEELQRLCDEFGCLAGEHRISWLRKQLRSTKISVE